ncbi:MAG: hypothetical protein GY869_25470, partial [Planctomycetes bacterium]|nr:hypothetical protein [Planctomycetota bacterium]
MKKLILIIVLLSPLSWVNPSLAADLEVCESGCAYSSIQEAIDVAGDGDTIKVAAGTYYESDITIDNSITLTIRGGYDAANFSNPPSTDPAATVVDALGLGRGFHIYAYNGETINVIIEGLTIVNGFTSGYGGGIYVEVTTYSSSLSDTTVKLDVRRVIINGNSAGYNGAGVYAYPYTGNDTFVSIFEITLSDSRIVGNTACDDGGGVYIRGYSSSSYAGMSEVRFSIEGNRINGNSATGYGGGMYIELDNCRYAGVIPGPVAKRAPVPGPSITSNEICRNSSASDITGLYIELEECTSTSEIDIINNVITGNWDYSGNRAPALYIYSEETSPEFNLFNNTVFGNYGYGFEAYSAGSGGVTDNFTLNL